LAGGRDELLEQDMTDWPADRAGDKTTRIVGCRGSIAFLAALSGGREVVSHDVPLGGPKLDGGMQVLWQPAVR
jgi:hypothetical protein